MRTPIFSRAFLRKTAAVLRFMYLYIYIYIKIYINIFTNIIFCLILSIVKHCYLSWHTCTLLYHKEEKRNAMIILIVLLRKSINCRRHHLTSVKSSISIVSVIVYMIFIDCYYYQLLLW